MESLYSIVYCSRNLINGEQEVIRQELQSILTTCRRNNERQGVTGALLYNAGSFAQVLEGTLEDVAAVFERIQRDDRHTEVTVIQSGPISKRHFPDWAMAFAGNSSYEGTPVATAAFEAVFAHAAGSGEQMLTMMHDLMVDEADWVLLDSMSASA